MMEHVRTFDHNSAPIVGFSRIACCCFDMINEMLGLRLKHIHITSEGKITGEETQGLIPGTKFQPDATDLDANEVWEFLGNAWHGYPPSHPKHAGFSHTGRSMADLYAGTFARMHLFRDHGYVVNYIWEHEFRLVMKKKKEEEKGGGGTQETLHALLAVIHTLY